MIKANIIRASIVFSGGLIFSCLLLSFYVLSLSAAENTPHNPEWLPTRTPSATPAITIGVTVVTLTPIPTGTPEPKPQSAAIILTMPDPNPALWTSVQWQNEQGGWIDASGWQSDFNENGMVVWAVAPNEYGIGPYRWVIYKEKEGMVQSISDVFFLPVSREVKFISVNE